MKKHILITGLPGVGKTVLMRKVGYKLSELDIPFSGFYTEELRDNKFIRTGFDIVTFDNQREILARRGESSGFKVGKYAVYPKNLEDLVIPIMENPQSVMIIDEIGKMELLSKRFEASVKKMLENKNIVVIATIPERANGHFISNLKKSPNSHMITVTKTNRNDLLKEIVSLVQNNLSIS